MTDQTLYAVFIHHGALEALGEAIKPYLSDGPHGKHIVCREIDSGGAFFEMVLEGTTPEGKKIELELMIPSNMVQMVVSTHSDEAFGFHHGRDPADAMRTRRKAAAPAKPATRDPLPNEKTVEPPVASKTLPPIEG
ncbi:MAG TPA: hypothetical protein VK753_12720 [Xanthomonadaceae bacterium]|jgi:hypothetical protein|nr:hypothetical protein [Xanthomonadaceae bacterium]